MTRSRRGSQSVAEFFEFLGSIRNYGSKRVLIDFSRVKSIRPVACVLVGAELEYLRTRGVAIRSVAPRSKRAHEVLAQTGIGDIVRLERIAQSDRQDVIHWRRATGGQEFDPALLEKSLPWYGSIPASILTRGMVECVGNALEHAYKSHPAKREFGDDCPRWWALQQMRDGVLTTCICDLGIGIARSLPLNCLDEPGLLPKLMAITKKLTTGEDVRAILAAIELGRTSTKLKHRGKGMRDAHLVIDGAKSGVLQIYSNSGFYQYADKKKINRKMQGDIHGTVYFWSYPINADETSELNYDLKE